MKGLIANTNDINLGNVTKTEHNIRLILMI